MGLVLYTLNFGLHTENGNINVCVCVFVRVFGPKERGSRIRMGDLCCFRCGPQLIVL